MALVGAALHSMVGALLQAQGVLLFPEANANTVRAISSAVGKTAGIKAPAGEHKGYTVSFA